MPIDHLANLNIEQRRAVEHGVGVEHATAPLLVIAGMPSDLDTGTTEEIEEERRLLYVAMTRAKDNLHLITPHRFFTHGQPSLGDRHVYASPLAVHTRHNLLPLFESVTWPTLATELDRQSAVNHGGSDAGARMRSMWQ